MAPVPRATIAFLTEVLDFTLAIAMPADNPFYAILHRGPDELQLNRTPPGQRAGGAAFIITCEGLDALFATVVARGLTVPTRPESPIHEGPLDQSWGTREVYFDEPGGNTVIYQQR